MKQLILYLQTNPSEEFVQSEIDRIENIIKSKSYNFEYWSNYVCNQEVPKNKRFDLFMKEIGLNKLNSQLNNLKYILKINLQKT